MAQLKKLHRSMHTSWVAGVVGGFAEYFGWSPNGLRWVIIGVTVLSAGISFVGLLPFYIVCLLVMPKATPDSYE